MSSKSFKGGFDSLLGEEEPQQKEKQKPPKQNVTKPKAVKKPQSFHEVRATFIMKEDLLSKLKAVSYWDRKQIKETINEAINLYLDSKGEKHVKEALKQFEGNK